MAKKTTNKKEKSMEEALWDTANKLRGTVESSEYEHVVLGLIFLKFASDKFVARRKELIEEEKAFYDILKTLDYKYDFDYPEDKLLVLAPR